MWVVEYALHDRPLKETLDFFRQSLDYLDGLAKVERYSYFGSFRNKASNVGPNVAMLDANGFLTDIGNMYLGLDGKSSSTNGTKGGAAITMAAPLIWDVVLPALAIVAACSFA
jgi:hypothetical protein